MKASGDRLYLLQGSSVMQRSHSLSQNGPVPHSNVPASVLSAEPYSYEDRFRILVSRTDEDVSSLVTMSCQP
jgi:hypothetical protein